MKRVKVIAEAGVNHNGSLDRAIELVNAAHKAGADMVKFQTFSADKLASPNAKLANYQLSSQSHTQSQWKMLKDLELSHDMHEKIIHHCENLGISFLSTAFCESDVDYLENKVDVFKIPSGEATNLPFLEYITKKSKPIILSTGRCDLEEVSNAVSTIKDTWQDIGYSPEKKIAPLTILHCTTAYPTKMSDVNLRAMLTLENQFQVPVGYSDHTLGIEVSVAAVALGATCIEKHFTLDRSLPGPDHQASLEPHELTMMIKAIRNIEKALGDGIKKPRGEEIENLPAARKSWHYSKNLVSGSVLDRNCLVMKRPGTGLTANDIKCVLGKKLVRNVQTNEIVRTSDFQI